MAKRRSSSSGQNESAFLGGLLGQTTEALDRWTVLGPYRGYVAPDVVHEHVKGFGKGFDHVVWEALQRLAHEENLLDGEAGHNLVVADYEYRFVRWPSAAAPKNAQLAAFSWLFCPMRGTSHTARSAHGEAKSVVSCVLPSAGLSNRVGSKSN